MYNSNGTQRMTSILSNILSNFFVYNSEQVETPEQLKKSEEDQKDDEDIRIYKKYLADEYISRRRADPSCLIGDKTSYKRKWIINNCKQCKSLITLDEFVDDDYEDLISIKILDKTDNENTYKMSKGNCLSKTELTQMLESERNSSSYQYIYCIWKNTSNTYDISGSKSEPTNILLFKLVLHDRTIFVTFNSLVRILKSQSKVFYAIPMYNNKNRRIGNLEDSVSESRLHGQIPGYKVYMLVNREDFSILSKSKTKRKYEFDIEKSGDLNKYPTYLKIKHTDLLTLNQECNNRYFTTIVINELLDFILTNKDERDFAFPIYVEIETVKLLHTFPYCQPDYLLELTMESIRRYHTEKT
jgi:hypothetical protein